MSTWKIGRIFGYVSFGATRWEKIGPGRYQAVTEVRDHDREGNIMIDCSPTLLAELSS